MIVTVTLNAAIDKLYLVDSLSPHEVVRVKEVINSAGGKGMNVSRVAALAGEKVVATGLVGGYNGELFKSLVPKENITSSFTKISAETRCCVNVREDNVKQSTEFLEPGQPVSESELRDFLTDFEAALPAADIVVISGSMPRGAPEDFYSVLIETARRHGKKTILDTSGAPLKASISAKPALIKPNADEIRQLLKVDIGSRGELIAAAKKIQTEGVEIVVVSLGKDGALIVCDEGVYCGVTPDIPVVNTVGCGDSMVAGFAIGLSRGCGMVETIRYAVAISTANALTKETGSFRPSDLERLLPQIKVNKL